MRFIGSFFGWLVLAQIGYSQLERTYDLMWLIPALAGVVGMSWCIYQYILHPNEQLYLEEFIKKPKKEINVDN